MSISAKEWKTFLEITRSLPELRKLRVRLRRFKWLSEALKKIESPIADYPEAVFALALVGGKSLSFPRVVSRHYF